MTSLVSTPKAAFLIEPNLQPEELDESLFTTWKSARNPKLARKRLSNRSWRLISERVFNGSQKVLDKSFLTLHDQPITQRPAFTCKHMSPTRPSLFSNSSRYTCDSILSLQKQKGLDADQDSGDESSDISEDDSGGDYFDYDPTQVQKAAQTSLPRSRHTSDSEGASPKRAYTEPSSLSNHIFKKEESIPKELKYSNGKKSASDANAKGNIFFISNSPSSPDHAGAKDELSKNVPPPLPVHLERKDSLFRSTATIGAGSTSDAVSSLSSTDISEDSDFEDRPTSLHENDINQVTADARSTKSGRSLKSTDDNESEWMSVSSESELAPESPEKQPISFAKRIPIPQSATEYNNSSPPAEDTLKSSPSSFKPRSLLSGLFLNEMNNGTVRSPVSAKSANLEHSAPKPVLKRSSTTGVITVETSNNARALQRPSILLSKRYASSSDFTKRVAPHRSPVLYIAEEDPTKQDQSRAAEQNLFAKQTSSVGLTNFLVMADAKKNANQANPRSVTPDDPDVTHPGADALLSSSLSKYSSLQRESSLKNIFSKSSINLTSLLGHGITNKLRLNGDNRSNETIRSMPPQASSSTAPQMASSFAEHLSQQNLMEPSKSESTITTSKSVRVEPTVFKDFQPSVEISESLKDSLMIDHKLGKAPLPDRVISDEDLFSGLDKGSFLHDPSDYHSKGW